MKAHLLYARYVFRHKYFVFLAGLKLGVPLWRLILHDWTKFLPREWIPYVDFFYGKKPTTSTESGYKHQFDNSDSDFNIAWNHHQKKNDHHWQYWIITLDRGETFCLPMSKYALLEMIADWIGAGRAQGKPNTWEWYAANKTKIQLHPDTRSEVDYLIEKLRKDSA